MSNASKRRRKEIVQRVREEGRQAALAGKHPQTNPHKFMDAFQWRSGYMAGLDELEAQESEGANLEREVE